MGAFLGALYFVRYVSASVEKIVWALSFSLLVCYIIFKQAFCRCEAVLLGITSLSLIRKTELLQKVCSQEKKNKQANKQIQNSTGAGEGVQQF